MKLDPPLANLIDRCQTICTPECCGVAAYDFSPIHIASFLTMWRGLPDEAEISIIRNQIQALQANYGISGVNASGTTIEVMNQVFSGEEIVTLGEELLANMEIAIRLVQLSE